MKSEYRVYYYMDKIDIWTFRKIIFYFDVTSKWKTFVKQLKIEINGNKFYEELSDKTLEL